jgi:hypothetical protein
MDPIIIIIIIIIIIDGEINGKCKSRKIMFA